MIRATVKNRNCQIGVALALLAAAAMGGCVVTIDSTGGGDGGGGGGESVITIRVINASGVTLDPQIYASANSVGVDELFNDGNKLTAYGVGTLGILGPASEDTFTVPCANARTIGTRGGAFGDNLNAPIGSGRQVVLAQDLSVFCNGELIFTFSGGGSSFTTTFDVNP